MCWGAACGPGGHECWAKRCFLGTLNRHAGAGGGWVPLARVHQHCCPGLLRARQGFGEACMQMWTVLAHGCEGSTVWGVGSDHRSVKAGGLCRELVLGEPDLGKLRGVRVTGLWPLELEGSRSLGEVGNVGPGDQQDWLVAS